MTISTYHHAGLTLPYQDSGRGEAVLLLHGFPEDIASWTGVADRLHVAGYRTLIPAMRGYAATTTPHSRRAYTIDALVTDLIALLDHLKLRRVHVVGHDWGGLLAWELAMRVPHRCQSLTVLGTPHPQAMVWSYTHSTQLLHSAYIGGFQLPYWPERLVAHGLHDRLTKAGLNPADTTRLTATFRRPATLTGPLNWYRALLLPHQPKVADSTLYVPTTYVWGRHDPFLGRAAATKTAAFVAADYRFVVLNAGHWLPENRPEVTAQLILDRMRRGSVVH